MGLKDGILESAKRILRDLTFNVIAASIITPMPVRKAIYNLGGMDIQTHLMAPRIFMGGNQISIGKGSYVNYNSFFDNLAPIQIGRNCFIAMKVMFCTSTHTFNDQIADDDPHKMPDDYKLGNSQGKEIIVGDNCWIGARATILPGVRIGENCVIAAGAVVSKDCAPNGVYAGVPAKRIRDIYKNQGQIDQSSCTFL